MFAGPFYRQPSQCEEEIRGRDSEIWAKMALMAPPTPCSNSRDYSKDDDSDSDVSEDSLGKVNLVFLSSVCLHGFSPLTV